MLKGCVYEWETARLDGGIIADIIMNCWVFKQSVQIIKLSFGKYQITEGCIPAISKAHAFTIWIKQKIKICMEL